MSGEAAFPRRAQNRSVGSSMLQPAENEHVRESPMQTPRNTEAPITEYMLIDGKLVDGTERIEVRNPARPDELVGTIVRGSLAHVDEAVADAKARQPGMGRPYLHGTRRHPEKGAFAPGSRH